MIFFPKRSFQRDHSGSILPEQWGTDKEEMDEGEQETEKRYMDTALPPKERAKALLEELSLEEKVAQLNCVCIFSEEGRTRRRSEG